MNNPHYRYFIEIQSRGDGLLARAIEAEARRAAAAGFVAIMREWLRERDLGDKVSAIGITLSGQIQITCEPAVMRLIRDQDVIDIAAIRQGAIYTETLDRLNDTREKIQGALPAVDTRMAHDEPLLCDR